MINIIKQTFNFYIFEGLGLIFVFVVFFFIVFLSSDFVSKKPCKKNVYTIVLTIIQL